MDMATQGLRGDPSCRDLKWEIRQAVMSAHAQLTQSESRLPPWKGTLYFLSIMVCPSLPTAILPIPTAPPAPRLHTSFRSKALLTHHRKGGHDAVQEPRGVTASVGERPGAGAWERPCAHLRKTSSDQGRSLMAQQSLVSPRASWDQPPWQPAGAAGLGGAKAQSWGWGRRRGQALPGAGGTRPGGGGLKDLAS